MAVNGNELTKGPVMSTMLRFAVPMIIGDLLQQCYNIADTIIVGRFLGTNPLAAVGSAFSLMTFLTSILLGLAMGSGSVFSMRFGRKDEKGLRESVLSSFVLLAAVNAVLNIIVFAGCDLIIQLLQIPEELTALMKEYLIVIFAGLTGIFLYNFFASLLRSLGNSKAPMLFLAAAAILNIVLDLWFVAGLDFGVAGAAWATVISQYVSGIGIAVYTGVKFPSLIRPDRSLRLKISSIKEIAGFSSLTCLQGRVNTFGPVIMAAFAAGVKIDAFAYLPVQDFGNAFSYFIAQNYGAGQKERIAKGIRTATVITISFGIVLSLLVCLFADSLIALFIDDSGSAALVIEEGVRYLRIEGAFYYLIGILFLLYGLYRALGRPGMSVVLTVISLGLRVVLAYALSSVPSIGAAGIWWSVPVGWIIADAAGIIYYMMKRKTILP